MKETQYIPYIPANLLPEKEMISKSENVMSEMLNRRTIREFSDKEVKREIIENCLTIAGSAPSGANMQPWHFAVVCSPKTKKRIREVAEEEEKEFYSSRAPQEWLDAIKPLGTDEKKPFLEIAPYLIIIFEKRFDNLPSGKKVKQYYTKESVGIATGFLITALHQCGLAALTHTPSPMNFLNTILDRPPNEKPYLILVVGYPAEDVLVPNIQRKPLSEIASFI